MTQTSTALDIRPEPILEVAPALTPLVSLINLDRLPDPLQALGRHGVVLISLVLTDFCAHGVGQTYALSKFLRHYAHASYREDGREHEGPCSYVDSDAPDRRDAPLLFGHDNYSFKAMCAQRARERGADVPLSPTMLCHIVAPDLWPVLAHLILDGPRVGALRSENALHEASTTAPRRTRRTLGREVTAPSDSWLSNLTSAANRLFRSLKAVRDLSRRYGPALDERGWSTAPKLKPPQTHREMTPTTVAPRRHEVRAAWQAMQRDIAGRLPAGAWASELEAIGSLGQTKAIHSGLWRLLRVRAIVVMLTAVGSRVGALPRLRPMDLVEDFETADGRRGPAIALRPGKTIPPWVIRMKPVPQELFDMLKALVVFVERATGEPMDPTGPLFLLDLASPKAYTNQSMMKRVGGSTGSKAFVPLDPGQPNHGYGTQTFRSACAQMIRSLPARETLEAERVDAEPHWVAEALLDHGLTGLDALYGGASKDRDRERLSAVGIDIAWRMLTTELGARKEHDLDALVAAAAEQQALTVELAALRAEQDALLAHMDVEQPAQHGFEALWEQNRALIGAGRLSVRERSVSDRLVALAVEIRDLELDPDRRAVVPDDRPGWHALSLGEVRRLVRSRLGAPVEEDSWISGAPPERRREYLSVKEFSFVAGKDPSPSSADGQTSPTVRRWLGGKQAPRLPFEHPDPRNPWPADRVPVDDRLGERFRRILVDGINPSWLDGDPGRRQRLAEVLATDGPDTWSDLRLATPLRYPAWWGTPVTSDGVDEAA